ncbi:MAG: ArsR family transcriptional regulator [Nitrososphaerota archaeon]|nr:ArsR family transcriptional regulator [Nitrososphaerota archaeon]
MSSETLESVVASGPRLRIANLVSSRPRTLRELSAETGVSVQGVLKHLKKLSGLGLVVEQKVRAGGIGARKVYAAKGTRVSDFSAGDLTIVKLSRVGRSSLESSDPMREVEGLSEDVILARRRIREQTRRLGRLIDELGEDQGRIDGIISSLDLSDEEKLLLLIAYTEESMEDAERVVRERLGVRDARRALEKAISKARRVAKK